jgi:hypothetical protein
MLNKTPLIEVTFGEALSGKTAECTTPGPSPALGLHPVLAPLTQLVSSIKPILKLAVRVFLTGATMSTALDAVAMASNRTLRITNFL